MNPKKLKKFILIDGNSLIYRAFYALPTTLATSAGQVTNAVYGFTSMLLKLVKEEAPDFMAVAFDRAAPTFRHREYKDYKAHREEMPDELVGQFPLVRDVLETLKIPIFERDGYEADDILAALAKEAGEESYEVIIISGDRDVLQLVSSQVKVMATRRGITDIKLYDREEVVQRYGLPPEKIVDMLALKGDPSDNIPGVPGIGEKTAVKLVKEFGSLEEVLARAEEIIPVRARQALQSHSEQAKLSKRLAVLDRDAPIKADLNQCRVGQWDEAEVRKLFEALEFNTLLQRFLGEKESLVVGEVKPLKVEVAPVLNEREWKALLKKAQKTKRVGFEVETTGVSASQRVTSLALACDEKKGYWIPLGKGKSELAKETVLKELKTYLESDRLLKVMWEAKSKYLALHNEGITLKQPVFDPSIAAYLLEPGRSKYSLDKLTRQYLEQTLPEDEDDSSARMVRRCLAAIQLQEPLAKTLKKEGLEELFEQLEIPLSSVLAKMELAGVGVDTKKLQLLSSELERLLENLEEDAYRLAGEKFNLNSPQQVGEILFEKLGLSPGRKTKTGYATDISVLSQLINEHPVVEKIIHYRELFKLKSGYVDALPQLVDRKTHRLHTTFSQTVTATGRLSSANPNLQNIPVRTELGQRIREAFVPARASDMLLTADYSQIELRILAHLSGDEALTDAFQQGEDIHLSTAAKVFKVGLAKVTPQMRRAAKAVNFGVVYGISPFGLSHQLRISKEEAKEYIDEYFRLHPAVDKFVKKTVAKAYQQGYVETILGRRRYLPELKSNNYRLKSFGERLAVNSPLQGSAADIIKIAMIQLDRELGKKGLQTRMVLQVHDELVFEVPPLEKDMAMGLVREVMENVYPLKVKLKVDVSLGPNWREAK